MKLILIYTLLSIIYTTRIMGQLDGLEVFFNQDPGPGNGIVLNLQSKPDAIDEIVNIALATTEPGSHRVFLRVRENNLWSHYHYLGLITFDDPLTSGDHGKIEMVEVFFNQDPGQGSGTISSPQPDSDETDEIMQLALPSTEPGKQNIFLRIQKNNQWSHYTFLGILTVNDVNLPDMISGEYFFDEFPGDGNLYVHEFPVSGITNMELTLPVGQLPVGSNGLFFRVNDGNSFSHYQFLPFMVSPDSNEFLADLKAFEYSFFDGSSGHIWNLLDILPTDEIDETILLEIPALDLGEHDIYIRLVDQRERFSHYTPLSFDVIGDVETSTQEPTISTGIRVYPNPASGIVYVVSDSEIIKVSLWDITGKLINTLEVRSNETRFNASTLNKGIYLLGVSVSNGTLIRKLIVE